MPMNYSIRLIKESIISTDLGMIWSNAGILLGILIVFLAIVCTIEYIKQRKNKNNINQKDENVKK